MLPMPMAFLARSPIRVRHAHPLIPPNCSTAGFSAGAAESTWAIQSPGSAKSWARSLRPVGRSRRMQGGRSERRHQQGGHQQGEDELAQRRWEEAHSDHLKSFPVVVGVERWRSAGWRDVESRRVGPIHQRPRSQGRHSDYRTRSIDSARDMVIDYRQSRHRHSR